MARAEHEDRDAAGARAALADRSHAALRIATPAPAGTVALLYATTAAAEGGPAAALAFGETSLVSHLLGQLESMGIGRAWIVTRPDWVAVIEELTADAPLEVRIVAADDVAGDLRRAADIASEARGGLFVGRADVLVHGQALAGVLADPRVPSGVLIRSGGTRGASSLRTRTLRGRVTSAGSAYHRVGQPNGQFLGFVKVGAPDRPQLAAAASELAPLAAERPDRWDEEFETKQHEWRLDLWAKQFEEPPTEVPDPAQWPALPLTAELEAILERRVSLAREDAVALLLVGLIRGGVQFAARFQRGFYFARPVSQEEMALAAQEYATYDEDDVALSAAVKGADGFFTTFFVSPYSRYIARFAARRGWTPNAITTVSMGIGIASAVAFATGNRAGMIAGAVLLQAAFTFDCVDGQLARYTRAFSKLGAWLDSVFDRGKEYVVYAGLALGASRGFGDDVWTLAAAALTLQTVRHVLDFSYSATSNQAIAATPQLALDRPEDARLAADLPARRARQRAAAEAATEAASAPPPPPTVGGVKGLAQRAVRWLYLLDRWPATKWLKRIVVLPIGERFALISITAAIWSPRTTFVALLAWGGFATLYMLAGRIVRSLAR